jgi:hypothetical protein
MKQHCCLHGLKVLSHPFAELFSSGTAERRTSRECLGHDTNGGTFLSVLSSSRKMTGESRMRNLDFLDTVIPSTWPTPGETTSRETLDKPPMQPTPGRILILRPTISTMHKTANPGLRTRAIYAEPFPNVPSRTQIAATPNTPRRVLHQ